MYELVRGKPIEQIQFEIVTAESGRKRHKLMCEDIFMFDTETTSALVDENGNVFPFDYDNPQRAKECRKHSLCYMWQFGINEDTRYIGRELYDFVLLLKKLHKYCPYFKSIWVHNLAFDFCFLQNVFEFTDVFARKPRHPMRASVKKYNAVFKCSYVLMNLGLESWAKSLDLPVKKHVGQLDYKKIRTPKTPLKPDEIDYGLADLDVMYYGLLKLKKEYGALYKVPMTHTGKARVAAVEIMKDEKYYCEKVTRLLPQNLHDYVMQAHAFLGGSVFCNWLYKNRTIKNVSAWDIASSYPWVVVACKYPQGILYKCPKGQEHKYINNDKYLYIIQFRVYDFESKYNCHFMSKSKALAIDNVKSDNGRLYRGKMAEFVLTSVDYELFIKLYSYSKIDIIDFRFCRAGYLSDTFRRFILQLYKDKTTLKNVDNMKDIYQNKKETINSLSYGDFVTKLFTDSVIYDENYIDPETNTPQLWHVERLNEERFNKTLKSLNKKRFKNYKAFIQGIFVTAWARKRIWDAVICLDEKIVYSDTDSLKMCDYDGDYFERANAEIMKRHAELMQELNVTIDDLSPEDINGVRHPLGVWEREKTAKFFRSLGCKQYMCEYEDGKKALTCAGVSKLAVQCFESVDDFHIDRTLTEKELLNCTDGNGHTAEKLTPYYGEDYPVTVYPDGYISKYKRGICLLPTTFNLSITPEDLKTLFNEVNSKLNKVYYTKGR